MKIAIIGSNGQLGSDLSIVLKRAHEIVQLTHEHIDVTDFSFVEKTLQAINPDVVINTAAYHNVPKCEENPDFCFRVNSLGALNVAKACGEKIQNIYISTDYVFDGKKGFPYTEKDPVNPLNYYGIAKVAGEHATMQYCSNYKIIRVSGLYGKTTCRAKGDNFITKMIKFSKEKPELKVVNDEILTPTWTIDIANQIEVLLNFSNSGIFHVSNSGSCSWYEFCCEIFKILDIKTPVIPVSASASLIKRPMYSVMENSETKKFDIHCMPNWKDSLRNFLI